MLQLRRHEQKKKDESRYGAVFTLEDSMAKGTPLEEDTCGRNERFLTKLGSVMKPILHQSEDADEVIAREGHRKVSPETAYFLKAAMRLDFEFEDEAGGVDMCKSIEKRYKEKEVTGAIKGMQLMGASDNEIISKIVEIFHVTEEYVLQLLVQNQV